MPPPAPRGGGRKKRMHSIRAPTRSPSVAASLAPQVLPPHATVEQAVQEKNRSALSDRYKCPICPPEDADVQLSEDSLVVCRNCGTLISNNPQLQNEVTFGENAQGAAVVQGTTLQDGQRRTHVQGLGHRGAEAPDRDQRLHGHVSQGREEIDRLIGHGLIIAEDTRQRAYNLFSLAKIHSFQRPIGENAAISIYTACREKKDNHILLIDLAELISVNVFELGAAYKKFLDRIGLTEKYQGSGESFQRMVEPEPLIRRFAKRLEFGDDVQKVSHDACAILRRMSRDWMVTGRQPMGLVGACLIIAARMNNYRRTLREVVYVVRAGEMTILKRLNEFSTTAAARLTVDQFRQLRDEDGRDNEILHATLKEALPPSLTTPRRKKRKVVHDVETIASSRQSSLAPTEASDMTDISEAEPRRDADGFLIPSLPTRARSESAAQTSPPPTPTSSIDPAIAGEPDADEEVEEEEEEPKPKRGRPKKLPLPKLDPTADDLAAEAAVEQDIAANMEAIESDASIASLRGPGWFRAKALADAAREEERKASKWKLSEVDLDGEIIEDDEFEDDPEVKYCKLTEREVKVKEQIWVTHNHDWLRAQQERLLQEQLASAKGKKKRTGPRRKMVRRGDGSVLGNTPVGSAAEASSRLMEVRGKRHKYSRHVDYAKLQAIYDEAEGGSEAATSPTSRSPSVSARSASRASSRSLASPSPSPAPSFKPVRRVSFASDVSEAPPSVASSAVAGAKRPAPEELQQEEEDDDDEDEDDLPPPGFGDDDEEPYTYDSDEDELAVAKEYGMDLGD